MNRQRPDFERFRVAVTRERLPDRVPVVEIGVDVEIMEEYLGTPIVDLKTYASFWERAGYDYVILQVRGQPLRDSPQVKIAEGQVRWQKQAATEATFGAAHVPDEAAFDAHPWIGPGDVYYRDVDEIRPLLPDGMKLIVNHGPLFQTIFRLMGLEALALATVENPALIEAIAEKVGELSVEIVSDLVQREWVAGVWYGDDMAYTAGLLVSPDFLGRYVFPYYKRMGQLCRQHGKLFIFHSDGKLTQVFDDLIDCGVQAIHPNEPASVDLVTLKQQWGDRFAFFGNIDVDLLARGTPEQVVGATKHLLENVAPGGGFALGSGNSVAHYTSIDNYRAMLDTVHRCGAIY